MTNNYCKGCIHSISDSRKYTNKDLKKSNYWCFAKGQAAEKAIAWCKTHDKKLLKT